MKNSLISTAAMILFLILYGCATAKKDVAANIKFKDNELLYYKNLQLIDPVSNLHWQYYEDNPTTYYRFKLINDGSLGKLPTIEQINALFQKIAFQLTSNKHQDTLVGLEWFKEDGKFLTSSFFKSNDGEIFYKVLHWDSKAKSISMTEVTGGDLVVVLLINEKLSP
jgi:hypothetical protein